ncbi:DUF4142 domain-containing protein [Billgrantia sp. LNSP4103-1]|uniref:DUF4142 domain-containing protein n=1 Tax=Billgrantia sp. LNSP4103-1 TaxID=3410266 RepID=UPI00403F8B1F
MKIFLAKHTIIFASVLVSLAAVPALADENREAVQASLRALHQHQVELAELAEERAERDEIAQLANTLRRDHAILDEWLAKATERSDTSVDEPAAYDHEDYETLQNAEGEAFDAAYLEYQENLLAAAIDYLERERSAEESELTEFDNHLRVTHESLLKNRARVESLR